MRSCKRAVTLSCASPSFEVRFRKTGGACACADPLRLPKIRRHRRRRLPAEGAHEQGRKAATGTTPAGLSTARVTDLPKVCTDLPEHSTGSSRPRRPCYVRRRRVTGRAFPSPARSSPSLKAPKTWRRKPLSRPLRTGLRLSSPRFPCPGSHALKGAVLSRIHGARQGVGANGPLSSWGCWGFSSVLRGVPSRFLPAPSPHAPSRPAEARSAGDETIPGRLATARRRTAAPPWMCWPQRVTLSRAWWPLPRARRQLARRSLAARS